MNRSYGEFREQDLLREGNRRQVYVQIKGQEAEFLILFQQFAETGDILHLDEIRSAQLKSNVKLEQRSRQLIDNYLSDGLQQVRKSDHYQDELRICSQKIFESMALAHLSFSPDQLLDEKISAVEAMIVRTDELLPRESKLQTLAWASGLDAVGQIHIRAKMGVSAIERATEPN